MMAAARRLLACLLAGILLASGCYGMLEEDSVNEPPKTPDDQDDGTDSIDDNSTDGSNGSDGSNSSDGGGEGGDGGNSSDGSGEGDDGDGDGVADSDDDCPDTPAGAEVDADGCQVEDPPEPPAFSDATHFVNLSCPLAGDGESSSCADSAAGPGAFNDLPAALLALEAGDLLQLAPGRYVGRLVIAESEGHANGNHTAPITVRGQSGVEVVGDQDDRVSLQVKTSWWSFEDLRVVNDGESATAVTAGQVKVRGPTEGVTLRGLDVDGQMRSMVGISIDCIEGIGCPANTLLENLTVYDQWLAEDGDAHCVYLDSSATAGDRVEQTTIRNLTAYGCDGDGVQIHQDKEGLKNSPNGILIEESHFYRAYAPGREENAIDVKAGTNVTIRNNRMHGFRPTNTSPPGSALVIHMGGGDTLIEGNDIWDSSYAIKVTHGSGAGSPRNVTIRNNLLHDLTMADYGHGIAVYINDVDEVKLLHNTIIRCEGACVEVTDSVTGVVIADNIVIDGSTELEISTQLAGNTSLIEIHHNLLRDSQGGRGRVNGNPFNDISCSECVDGEPLFSDSVGNDFHLLAGSAAIDVGLDVGVEFDADGCSRDSSPDIGAYEWTTQC